MYQRRLAVTVALVLVLVLVSVVGMVMVWMAIVTVPVGTRTTATVGAAVGAAGRTTAAQLIGPLPWGGCLAGEWTGWAVPRVRVVVVVAGTMVVVCMLVVVGMASGGQVQGATLWRQAAAAQAIQTPPQATARAVLR